MANLRVVYDNAVDRATIVASATAGSLAASNLKTDYKSEIWRSTGQTATLTFTWATGELLGMFALAFCNLTSAATFRIRGYAEATDSVPVFDLSSQAASGVSLSDLAWGTEPLGVNAYAYGGGSYGSAWFPQGAYKKLVVDVSDNSLAGFLEASRAISGPYWSPVYNTEYGCSVGIIDNSKQERTDAGDLRTDRGTVHKTLSFDLNYMPKADRDALFNIIRGNGLFRPIYVSLMPEDSDSLGEQVFQVYGKMAKQASIKYQFLNQYSASLDVEEI